MPNTIKTTYGGHSYRVLTPSAKAEIAAAATAAAELAQSPVVVESTAGKKTKGQIGKKTALAQVEETIDAHEETSADN